MALTTGTTIGSYEVTAKIGEGGMGEVYRARDRKLDRDVALKVLPEAFTADPERLARFEREAKVLASLNHPNIASIFGLEDSGDTKALVLELVEGPTLADRIAQGAMPIEDALPIATQMAEALEAAHEAGVIHRDLKPANIKVRGDGTVKVLDFGLAKAFQPEAADASVSQSPTISLTAAATQMGMVLGTAAYMAPEQARGKVVDKRADIWAFGAVLFEMLAGTRPFEGEDLSLTLAAVMTKEPAWSQLPTGTPTPVERLLRRCLEKEPRRRVRDIGEARILLEDPDVMSGGQTEAEPPAPQPAVRPWVWMGTTAASLLLLAGVILFGRPAPSADRVLRYSIPLPPDTLTFSQAVSPDGRRIAVERVADRTTRIYVRALDGWDLELLPGTEGGTAPFWSPDSRSIGFFAGGKLKTMAVDGGLIEELADAPGLFGAHGTWGRDDLIVFAPSAKYEPGPLFSVRAGGGESSPLTEVEPGESHQFPAFLPDGMHLLYTSVDGSSPGIYLASLDDHSGRRLLGDETNVQFAPASEVGGPAHLLFNRNGNLMAQAFDTDQLELTGEPLLLLDQVPYGDNGRTDVSASGDGTMFYLGGGTRERDSRFSWFDRSGARLSDEGELGPPAPVALSADGNAMVALRTPPDETVSTTWWLSDAWFRELTRGSETRLTSQNLIDNAGNVVWLPGDRIVFTAKPADQFDLFWLDTRAAGPPQLLLASEHPKYATDVSRDGRYLLYTENHPQTQGDLWYLPLDGDSADAAPSAAEPVAFLQSAFIESAGQLSPDGRWLAYTSDEAGGSDIYVRPFPSGVGVTKISNGRSVQPRWSADGRELFYLSGPAARPTLMRVPVTIAPPSGGAPPVFEPGTPEPLFDIRANSYHPVTGTNFYAVSADGQRFLVNHIDATEDPVVNVVTNWRDAFGVPEER